MHRAPLDIQRGFFVCRPAADHNQCQKAAPRGHTSGVRLSLVRAGQNWSNELTVRPKTHCIFLTIFLTIGCVLFGSQSWVWHTPEGVWMMRRRIAYWLTRIQQDVEILFKGLAHGAAALQKPWHVLWVAGEKFDRVHGFLLASALAFSIAICIFPAILIFFSIGTTIVSSSQIVLDDIMQIITRVLPHHAENLESGIRSYLHHGQVVGLIGLIGLFWTTSRVFATVRTILHLVLKTPSPINILLQRLLDLGMVFLILILFLLSVGASSAVTVLRGMVGEWLTANHFATGWLEVALGIGFSFGLAFVMFYLLYYLPTAGVLPPSICTKVAVAITLLWEAAKWLFQIYLANLANFDRFYGSFGVIVAVYIWMYYSALIFIFGAALAAALFEKSARRSDPAPE